MKPIEPGCLAVVVPLGVDVQIGRYVGKPDFRTPVTDAWEVSKPIPWMTIRGGRKVKVGYFRLCPQWALMRIDGFEETSDQELERVA